MKRKMEETTTRMSNNNKKTSTTAAPITPYHNNNNQTMQNSMNAISCPDNINSSTKNIQNLPPTAAVATTTTAIPPHQSPLEKKNSLSTENIDQSFMLMLMSMSIAERSERTVVNDDMEQKHIPDHFFGADLVRNPDGEKTKIYF